MAASSPAEQPVDVAAALAQHKNLALMWHLLYDPDWQVGGGFMWQHVASVAQHTSAYCCFHAWKPGNLCDAAPWTNRAPCALPPLPLCS